MHYDRLEGQTDDEAVEAARVGIEVAADEAAQSSDGPAPEQSAAASGMEVEVNPRVGEEPSEGDARTAEPCARKERVNDRQF